MQPAAPLRSGSRGHTSSGASTRTAPRRHADSGPPQGGPRATDGRSLKDKAYSAIKHRIIIGAFASGEHLNEAAVAAALDIGRTPVHQAFDRLRLEGLVDVLPRRGVVVRSVDLDEAIQIIEARLLNEAYAVRLAAERASPAEIVGMRDTLARADKAAQSADPESSMLLDREFHIQLAEAARNFVLADILLNLHERSLRLWSISLKIPEHLREVGAQHDAIFRAICLRDPQAAERAMLSHIHSFRGNVLANF